MSDDDGFQEEISSGRPKGPFGIDPLHFSAFLFLVLLLFVFYLLLPRGFRVHHFGGYPKRYAWSARSRAVRGRSMGRNVHNGQHPHPPASTVGSSVTGASHMPQHRHLAAQGLGMQSNASNPLYAPGGRRSRSGISAVSNQTPQTQQLFEQSHQRNNEEVINFNNTPQPQPIVDLQQNEEVVISAAMQQIRDPGVLIVAHGSRGKPKTVRLQLTESAITWRTETRKKAAPNSAPKMGKLHQVPLSHIMYVDVGKQTTALRRVENAGVSEALCFSLLTKEGSLDLEANSPRERDALVSCFSLVLDEVHAQNWRDIYRGPSSDMPSSFDDFDTEEMMQGGQNR